MVFIPEGMYEHPGGLLLVVDSGGGEGAVIRFVPAAGAVPDGVTALDWFWSEKGFDGTGVDLGSGLTDAQAAALPAIWRYEDCMTPNSGESGTIRG